MSEEPERHSHALEPSLVSDPDEIARIEARNGVRQFDAVTEMIEHFCDPERKFKLRPSQLLHLHRIALEGLSSYAGNWRPAGIQIKGSKHEPVGAHLVPEEIEHMCDYVNENWDKSSPLHLASYALWKLKLDSSLHRRKRSNRPRIFVPAALYPAWLSSSWQQDNSRSDRSEQGALLQGLGSRRRTLVLA
jgi:hypothetical protein